MEVKGWSRAGPRKRCLGAAGPAPSGTAAHALHPNTSLSLAGGKSHSLVSCCMVCVSPTSSSCCHCAVNGTEAQQVPASGSLSKKLWWPRKHLPLSPCCPPGPLVAHLGPTCTSPHAALQHPSLHTWVTPAPLAMLHARQNLLLPSSEDLLLTEILSQQWVILPWFVLRGDSAPSPPGGLLPSTSSGAGERVLCI